MDYIILMGPWGSVGPVPAESYFTGGPRKTIVAAITQELSRYYETHVEAPARIAVHPETMYQLRKWQRDNPCGPITCTPDAGWTMYGYPLREDVKVASFKIEGDMPRVLVKRDSLLDVAADAEAHVRKLDNAMRGV